MPELGSSGSVRGARGNPRSYRDRGLFLKAMRAMAASGSKFGLLRKDQNNPAPDPFPGFSGGVSTASLQGPVRDWYCSLTPGCS